MKTINYLLIICIAIASISCAGNKFDYQSAYKFKSPNTKHIGIYPNEPDGDFSADIMTTAPSQKNIELNKNIEFPAAKVNSNLTENTTDEQILTSLSKKERKIFNRIEKKIERKLEAKPAASKSVNSKIYTGVVIGGAGLILMILAGGTLGAIGGLALLVGLGFIVWGLLE